MKTKPLSIQEYGSSLWYNSKQDILNLVNREALVVWSKSENPPLPKFNYRVERVPLTAGVANFIKTVLLECRP